MLTVCHVLHRFSLLRIASLNRQMFVLCWVCGWCPFKDYSFTHKRPSTWRLLSLPSNMLYGNKEKCIALEGAPTIWSEMCIVKWASVTLVEEKCIFQSSPSFLKKRVDDLLQTCWGKKNRFNRNLNVFLFFFVLSLLCSSWLKVQSQLRISNELDSVAINSGCASGIFLYPFYEEEGP